VFIFLIGINTALEVLLSPISFILFAKNSILQISFNFSNSIIIMILSSNLPDKIKHHQSSC